MASKKEQILEQSFVLFMEKGFDETSISDILEHLNIARGTLYYHFESKEAIMDAIIDRLGQQIIEAVEEVIHDEQLSVIEKLYGLFAKMNLAQLTGGEQMLDYLHRPQNALLHEKSNKMILANVTPLLTQLIEEGIEQHIFENDFPAETAEMILLIISGFMDGSQAGNPQRRLDSLLFNLERLLGAERGTLLSFNNLITQ